MIRLIVATDRRRGLAKHGILPWYIPEDEKYFTDQTKTHGGHVLTGSTTFKDTYKGKPLPGRRNYILTRHKEPIEGVELVHDLDKFLDGFKDRDLWVAGGAEVFELVIKTGKADELYITHIDADFHCDQFFPEYENGFVLADETEIREQNGFNFTYARHDKI